jgi:hypothetical protein
MSKNNLAWLDSEVSVPDGWSKATLLGEAVPSKPTLGSLYADYLTQFAPIRASSRTIGPVADFVEVLRQKDKTGVYSDEEWIDFLVQFTGGDVDAAADMWDGMVCQP